jgi:hypothetical protein
MHKVAHLAELAFHVGNVLLLSGGKYYLGAEPEQLQHNGLPDPFGASGHQRPFSVQIPGIHRWQMFDQISLHSMKMS